MPRLSRWFVKSALLCLILGSLAAGLSLSGAAWPIPPVLAGLRPLAWHLLTVGWATQLIFGVAFWMFPHASKTQPRGDERLGWLAFTSLNAGLLLRAIGEPASAQWTLPVFNVALALAALLQVAAIALFGVFTWPRVKALGR